MAASNNKDDDALSLPGSDSESQFSGFDSEPDITPKVPSVVLKVDKRKGIPKADSLVSEKKKTSKNVSTKGKGKKGLPKSSNASEKSKTSAGSSTSNKHLVDLNNLSVQDISNLRNILGVSDPFLGSNDSANPVPPGEKVTVEVENPHDNDVVLSYGYDDDDDFGMYNDYGPVDPLFPGNEEVLHAEKLQQKLENCFDDQSSVNSRSVNVTNVDKSQENSPENDISWDLPKLKAPERGENISSSLAKLICMACTNSCQLDDSLQRYKVPANCETVCPPRVNDEIWGDLIKYKRVQSTDKAFRDIQNLVTAGILPILELTKILKGHSSVLSQVKSCIADALTFLGQVQYNISLRRRYLMRPFLKYRYSTLCSLSTPITSLLFGDDISKEIKKCENLNKLGKFPYPYNRFSRGRGFVPMANRTLGPMRRGRGNAYRSRPYGYGGRNYNQQQASSNYGQFGYQHNFNKRATATATSSSATANPN